MRNTILSLIFIGFGLSVAMAQTTGADTYISVNDTVSDQALVKEILINDPCALVDNVLAITGTDFGGNCDGISYFTNKNPDFPIKEGVVLATSDAETDAPGPPTAGGGCNWPDDSQLTDYMHDVLGNTDAFHTASSLEFEFTPVVDSISFNFVFASSEYGTFQCAYADAFAFFLENADTGEITNLALVPGTNDPISVVTIRDKQFNGGCSSQNKQYFDTFYDNTMAGAVPIGYGPTGYYGNTVLMTAAGKVQPFQKYRMKLVIQNRGDTAYQSAVFLEAGSFNIGSTDFLGTDITPDSPEAVCEGDVVDLTVSGLIDVIDDASVTWYKDGEEMKDVADQSTISVTEEGVYAVSIASPQFEECSFDDEISVEFKETPHIPEEFDGTKTFCKDFEYTLVGTPDNLNELYSLTYEWYEDGVQMDDEKGSTLTVSEPGTYTVVVSNVDCSSSATMVIEQPKFSVDFADDEIEFCEGENVELVPEIEGIEPDEADYTWSTGEQTPTITVDEAGTYTVDVSYGGCEHKADIEVGVWTLPEVDLGEDFHICKGDEVELEPEVSNTDSSDLVYDWYRDGTLLQSGSEKAIQVEDEGVYEVDIYEVGSPGNCTGTDQVEVSYYDNADCVITQGLSPGNNDGKNDYLDLAFLNDRSGISKLTVYNRYGTKVYDKSDYIDQWHGQDDNGKELVSGTYYYVLEMRNEDPIFGKVKKGWIYINQSTN